MSGSARTAAAASEGEGSLRQGCRDALQALEELRPLDAIDLAVDLTAKHPHSPIAFNLAATVFEIAGNRALNLAKDVDATQLSLADEEYLEALPDGMHPYFHSAMEHYREAARLAPNCVVTAVAHGRMLARCDMIQGAFSELKRSLGLTSPTQPDATSPWLFGEVSEPGMKKLLAKESARNEFNLFMGITEDRVYTKCCELIERHDVSTDRAAGVRKEAKDLAARYPFSPRAQLLFPFLHREFVQNLPLPPEADRSRLYRQVLGTIQNCADVFHASLVISLFRAEILTDVGQQRDAAEECIRGLNIQIPDDPVDQDLPPGSVDGTGRAARIATVTEQILSLLEYIEGQIAEAAANHQPAVDEPPNALKPQRKKIPRKVDSYRRKQQLRQVPMKPLPPKGEKSEMKQSVLYRFSRLKKTKRAAAPRPEQLIGNDVVPAETVDIYAEYCRILSRCSKYKLVCHMCVFDEQDTYTCKFPRSELTWHCIGKHQASGIKCEVDGCFVRFKTEEEASLHNNYCHCLPNDWWTR